LGKLLKQWQCSVSPSEDGAREWERENVSLLSTKQPQGLTRAEMLGWAPSEEGLTESPSEEGLAMSPSEEGPTLSQALVLMK
jgi:hypothetical protein